MEPAKIDWKNLEWRFVEDDLYEHINAPKWFDFLSPLDHSVDDEAWFCRPDCNHPKTAQDFLKSTPPKLASPAGISQICPLDQRSQSSNRDGKVKRRGLLAQAWLSPSSNTKFNEDSENQNPNLSTPPYKHQAKILKAAIKSSAEKKEALDEALPPPLPRLKSTLSARNLFAGRDILNQITEFCSELKRMAIRAKDRDNEETVKENLVVVKVKEEEEESKAEVLSELDLRGKEKPFQEREGSILKEKPRRKKRTDMENIPISVNLENVKRKEDHNLLQIRTNPPSPQCFSATRKTTPSKSKLMERGILQEQNKQQLVAKEESVDKNRSGSIVETREARTLDVFWFLKPCTLSTHNNA